VGEFGVGFWELDCEFSLNIWCGFVGVSFCCVWDSSLWVCGSACVLYMGKFSFGNGGLIVCLSVRFWCGFELIYFVVCGRSLWVLGE